MSMASSRSLRRLLCLLCAAILLSAPLSACQSGGDDDKPRPDTVAVNWRQIPLADLPSVFFGLTAGSLVTAKDGFLFAGRLPGGGSEMYRSADGIHWRASQPSAGNMSVRALAAYDGEVVAGGKVLRDGEDSPAVIRYRGEGRWSAVQYLPGGKPSDVVLAAARGPRGSVVVGHDGGPFEPDTERKRGRSLRVWVSTGTDPFGAPHEVTCPQWPDQEPEVGALADEHGFTVWARCADPWGTSKSLVIDSSDGADWHTAVGPRTSLPLNAAVSGPSGSVVLTGPLTSAAATAKSPEAWSRKASADGSGWRRTGSLGGTEGERRLIGDVVAVPGGYVAAGSAETWPASPVPCGLPPMGGTGTGRRAARTASGSRCGWMPSRSTRAPSSPSAPTRPRTGTRPPTPGCGWARLPGTRRSRSPPRARGFGRSPVTGAGRRAH